MDFQGHIPIYKKLTDYYRQRIINQDYIPGSKIDSINKMMTRHSVSRETAKRVIKNLITEQLVVSQAGRGTYIAETTQLLPKWGVVIPFYSSNIEELIAQLSKEASYANKDLEYFLHYNNPEEEMRYIGQLIQKGYEAIIVVPNYDESITGSFYRKLSTGNTKLVLADNTMAGSYFNYAIQSYDLGVKRAFDYLSSTHSGNYLLLNDDNWKGRNLVYDLVKQTFEMLISKNKPVNSLFFINNIDKIDASFLRENNIQGVITMKDTLAIRLIGRLKKWNFNIPNDISIVAYGNTELTELFQPSITSIDCRYDFMANNIARLINGDNTLESNQIIIQPEIIYRET